MPMQMDPSVGEEPDDEAKRNIQQVRGGGARRTASMQRAANARFERSQARGRLSTSERPIYADDSVSSTSIKRPVSYEGSGFNPYAKFEPATPMSPEDAEARGLVDKGAAWSALTGPPGAEEAGNDMAGAYQALLHSVALQHGGKPPANGSTPQAGLNGQTPKVDPKQAFQDLLHSVAIQHGGQTPSGGVGAVPPERSAGPSVTPPSGGPASSLFTKPVPKDLKEADALWKERGDYVRKQQREQYQPEKKEGLPLPPKLPQNATPEEAAQHKIDHQEWEDEIKFHMAIARLNAREGATALKAKLAAAKSEYDVVNSELDNARGKFENSIGYFKPNGDPELKKAFDQAQSLFGRIKAKRDAIISSTLDSKEEGGSDVSMGDGTRDDPLIIESEEEARQDKYVGKFVSVNGKLHRVDPDE